MYHLLDKEKVFLLQKKQLQNIHRLWLIEPSKLQSLSSFFVCRGNKISLISQSGYHRYLYPLGTRDRGKFHGRW